MMVVVLCLLLLLLLLLCDNLSPRMLSLSLAPPQHIFSLAQRAPSRVCMHWSSLCGNGWRTGERLNTTAGWLALVVNKDMETARAMQSSRKNYAHAIGLGLCRTIAYTFGHTVSFFLFCCCCSLLLAAVRLLCLYKIYLHVFFTRNMYICGWLCMCAEYTVALLLHIHTYYMYIILQVYGSATCVYWVMGNV